MNQLLSQIFQEPEKRYLNQQELGLLSKLVSSLPERIKIYRYLRDNETKLVQTLVDQLPAELAQTEAVALEQAVKSIILILRYLAMSMLTDDADLAHRRLDDWLPAMVEAHQNQAVLQALHRSLTQALSKTLSTKQFALLRPSLERVQPLLTEAAMADAETPLLEAV
ncbi:MAG: hypothetical protein AAFZ80_10970 [Cyanobacteria bacterium P01_A01_bin.105]